MSIKEFWSKCNKAIDISVTKMLMLMLAYSPQSCTPIHAIADCVRILYYCMYLHICCLWCNDNTYNWKYKIHTFLIY